jgi:hypothetical protein
MAVLQASDDVSDPATTVLHVQDGISRPATTVLHARHVDKASRKR